MLRQKSTEFNIDLNAKDINGQTAFHLACRSGVHFNFNIVEVMIRHAKSFNFVHTTKDNNGRTGFALLLPRDFQRIINLIKRLLPNIADEIMQEYKKVDSSDIFK